MKGLLSPGEDVRFYSKCRATRHCIVGFMTEMLSMGKLDWEGASVEQWGQCSSGSGDGDGGGSGWTVAIERARKHRVFRLH